MGFSRVFLRRRPWWSDCQPLAQPLPLGFLGDCSYIYVPTLKAIHHLIFGGSTLSNIDFSSLLLISDLTLGFAATHHHRLADHSEHHL
jgi:hypothetical protein